MYTRTLREDKMTESTIDTDRMMQGIDCEVITWTKCSERMPPDKPGNPIIVKFQNGKLVKMSARWFLNVVVNGTNIDLVS